MLTVDHPCYVERTPVTYHGTGYTAGANWFIEAQQVYNMGVVAPDGSFTVTSDAPINPNENTQAEDVTVNGYQEGDDGNTILGTVTYKVVSLEAQASHLAGNPRRFTKWGFSGFAPGKTIYFHVKHGHHVWTQKVGRGSRPCGILHRKLRRLPAVPASAVHTGKYKFIVDNHRQAGKGGRRYVIGYQIY